MSDGKNSKIYLPNGLLEEYFHNWISNDFLGRLSPRSEGTFLGTSDNDNGILFLAIGMMLLYKLNSLPNVKNLVNDSINLLEVEKGLYNRRKNDDDMDSHDNSVGIYTLSILFNLNYIYDILNYGKKHWYNYNNRFPGKFEWRCQRQGGDIAFYRICTGDQPGLYFTIWMIVGLWLSAFQKKPSTICLGWLRFETLKIALKTQKYSYITKFLVGFGEKIFNNILKKREISIVWAFTHYYRADHPIISFVKLYFT